MDWDWAEVISRKDVVIRIMGLLTLYILGQVEGQSDCLLVGGCYVHDNVGWGKLRRCRLSDSTRRS
jgi:hypothetical protein